MYNRWFNRFCCIEAWFSMLVCVPVNKINWYFSFTSLVILLVLGAVLLLLSLWAAFKVSSNLRICNPRMCKIVISVNNNDSKSWSHYSFFGLIWQASLKVVWHYHLVFSIRNPFLKSNWEWKFGSIWHLTIFLWFTWSWYVLNQFQGKQAKNYTPLREMM